MSFRRISRGERDADRKNRVGNESRKAERPEEKGGGAADRLLGKGAVFTDLSLSPKLYGAAMTEKAAFQEDRDVLHEPVYFKDGRGRLAEINRPEDLKRIEALYFDGGMKSPAAIQKGRRYCIRVCHTIAPYVKPLWPIMQMAHPALPKFARPAA